jgi:serine/threonine-protein kinase
MGVVYEAEQVSLGRRVALKILPRHVAGDRKALPRFRREAKAAARLHHTNIVPVFEIGVDGDVAFYAMQFIQGQGLDEVIDELRRSRAADRNPVTKDRDHDRSVTQAGPAHTFTRAGAPRRTDPKLGSVAESLLAGRLGTEATRSSRGVTPTATEAAGTEPFDPDATLGAELGNPAEAYPAIAPAAVGSNSAVLPGGAAVLSVESASRRQPYFRSVAQIGRQTAQGLAYAHSRGVVHRDIKPSNLLLDMAEVVWITDFGLAKAEEDGLTATGDILGTLRYMAPERFRGEGDARADIYGLGMTLYELLTFRPAFETSDRLKLIERVKSEEPPRPRSLDGRIPRDLETIVLKAIDKDPQRRYQSADELAEDLQRFVNDEPIKARRIGAAERLVRWCRRNPAVASLTAAVLVLMAVGTAVSTWQAVVANLARADLATKNAELAAEQAKVEARFELAQKAIAMFHTGVSEDMLLKNDQFTELRTKLLEGAAGFYADLEKLLAEQTDSRSRRALAEGYEQLAELTGKIGSQPEALAIHRKALAIRRELAAQAGADVETRLDVAHSLTKVGRLLWETGDEVGALTTFEQARDLAERLEVDAPTDAVRSVLAQSHNSVGYALYSTGKSVEALAAYQKSLAIRQKLADANPSVTEFQVAMSSSHNNIGDLLRDTGRPAEALEAHGEALAIVQKLANANPADATIQMNLAGTYNNFGKVLSQTEKPQRALEAQRQALVIRQRLAEASPAVTQYQIDLAWCYDQIGDLLSKTGKPAEAEAEFRRALEIRKKLADDNPKVPGYRSRLVYSLLGHAALQAWFGQDAEWRATCRRALEYARNGDHLTQQRAAHVCCLRPSADSEQFKTALDLARRAVELDEGKLYYDWRQMTLGMAEYRNGRYAEADKTLAAAAETGAQYPAVRITSAFYRAMSLFKQGQAEEARRLALEAAAQMKPLPQDDRNPLAGDADHDDLILWLAYKEARALLNLQAAPTASTPTENRK